MYVFASDRYPSMSETVGTKSNALFYNTIVMSEHNVCDSQLVFDLELVRIALANNWGGRDYQPRNTAEGDCDMGATATTVASLEEFSKYFYN